MSKISKLALAAVALLALSATAEAGALTNGPNGTQPNRLASRMRTGGANSQMPSRAVLHRHRR